MAKKLAKATLLICVLACLILSACNHKILFSLYFRVDDEVYAVINTAGKEIISVPKDPVKDDMIFDGWYWDKNVWEKPFTANSLLDAPLTSNMSVYAKFKEKAHECEFSSEWKSDENKHWHECSCGKKEGEEEHFWSEWAVKTPATVDSKEVQERTCEICKRAEQREVERYAKYTTEYYLQNLENDEYTLEESSSLFGVIGSTVKAEIKKYPHFSAEKSEVTGIVSGADDTVIKVYYKRDVYTVTFNANGGTLKSGSEVQRVKYQGSAIAPEYTRYGYVFNGFDGYYENVDKDITVRAKWGDVQKQNYDMSGVKFESKSVVFNGESHSIFISGKLPDGVTVEYINNGKINAGTYTVTAKFTGDSVYYNPIPDKNATLIINKAEYDMSAVSFLGSEKIYSGERFSIKISGTLPAGVSVKYFNVDGSVFAGKTDRGDYPITARFYGDAENYKTIPDMTAILSILPKKLDAPVIKEVKYDAVYWTKVENAESYIVRVNDDYTFSTRSNQCDLSKLKNEAGESLEIIRDSSGNIKPVKIEVMAKAGGNFESSNHSAVHEEYYYIPESNNSQKATLSTYGIGYGYNVIENDSLNFSGTSQDSVFNLAKLLSVCEFTKTMPSNKNEGKSYSYTSVDEFMSNISMAYEYGASIESPFIGGVKSELSANVGFKYKDYIYNSTFDYVASVSSYTYALKQFYSEEMLSKCLSIAFLKDIRREIGSNTYGMDDNTLFEYLYKHYGTHAILGVTTGAEYVARCTVSTNKRDVAAKFAMGFKASANSASTFEDLVKANFNVSFSGNEQIEWHGEETNSAFSAYYKGSVGGLTSDLNSVSSAVKTWSEKINTDNAIATGFSKNGAISLISLIGFYDAGLAIKYDEFIQKKYDETCNEIYGLYNNKTINIPVTMENSDGKNVLSIDLSSFQGNDNIKNAKYPGFINGVFNVYPIMCGKNIDAVKIIGDYKNNKGIIDGFSLKISDKFKSDVNIILENLGIAAANENGFIDVTEAKSNIKLNVSYIGECAIKAAAKTTGNGNAAFTVNDITFTSAFKDATLSIYGGTGANGANAEKGKIGNTGFAGGVAINARRVSISGKGSMVLYGGNGGIGGVGGTGENGQKGADKSWGNGDNGGSGRNGESGGVGGSGGKAFIENVSLSIEDVQITLVGGNGGKGGTGGKGGNGGNGGKATALGQSGGNGGNGGNGGIGGIGGNGAEDTIFINRQGVIVIPGKNGLCGSIGYAGTGGAGGTHSDLATNDGNSGSLGNGTVCEFKSESSYYRAVKCNAGEISWHQAQTIAQNEGGHLVTITSKEENDLLVNNLTLNMKVMVGMRYGFRSIWIGLTDEKEEGKFTWVTGEKFDYSNWNSGEPNNDNNEDYVALYIKISGNLWHQTADLVWNDYRVSHSEINGYVIEYDL